MALAKQPRYMRNRSVVGTNLAKSMRMLPPGVDGAVEGQKLSKFYAGEGPNLG